MCQTAAQAALLALSLSALCATMMGSIAIYTVIAALRNSKITQRLVPRFGQNISAGPRIGDATLTMGAKYAPSRRQDDRSVQRITLPNSWIA